MTTKWDELNNFCILVDGNIAYNDELKKKFQTKGKAALKQLAEALEATEKVKHCNISYSKGGIAVSGDFHLRGDFDSDGAFDLFFNCDGFCRYMTYRKTKNKSDYTGDFNRQINFGTPIEDVISSVLRLGGYN